MNHINIEPKKLPKIQIKIEKSKVLATPKVIIFAIQCWNPQKINKGIPKIIPTDVPFLYIYTAIYIIIPHKSDLIKKEIDISQVAILAIATSIKVLSVMEYIKPNK